MQLIPGITSQLFPRGEGALSGRHSDRPSTDTVCLVVGRGKDGDEQGRVRKGAEVAASCNPHQGPLGVVKYWYRAV